MTYLIGLLGLLIGIISPALGVLLLICTSGKYFIETPGYTFKFFLIWILTSGFLFIFNIIDKVQIANLIFGAGFSCILLFYLIKKEYQQNYIFLTLFGFNVVYVLVRQLLYSEYINNMYLESVEGAVTMLSNRFQAGSEQYVLFMDLIEMSKDFYLKYSPGIWIATMLMCLIFGYYFLSRKLRTLESYDLEPLSHYQTHNYAIYSLILALIVAVFFTKYRVISINLLLALMPLFLLQGFAVIKMKIGKWFVNSKFLLVLAILTLLINPYVILFISVIGLFDNWFDFRSLSKMEEINEDNTDRDT